MNRNVLICIRNGCERCKGDWSNNQIPDDCEFGILHALLKGQECGFNVMPRRSGKTTAAVRIANELVESGNVLFFTYNSDMARHLQRTYGLDKLVKVGTAFQLKHGNAPCGFVVDYIVSDEVEERLIRYAEGLYREAVFVVGFASPEMA